MKPAFGVHVKVPAGSSTSVPFATALPPFTTLQASCAFAWSGSLSLAPTSPDACTPSLVEKVLSAATGGSFTGAITMVAVA